MQKVTNQRKHSTLSFLIEYLVTSVSSANYVLKRKTFGIKAGIITRVSCDNDYVIMYRENEQNKHHTSSTVPLKCLCTYERLIEKVIESKTVARLLEMYCVAQIKQFHMG